MFCSKCGKEIPDDSIFCYSCGSKTINENTSSVLKESGIIETKNEVEVSSIKEKVEDNKEQAINNKNNSNQGENKKRESNIGAIILFFLYGYSIFNWIKNKDIGTITSTSIFLSFPIVIILYYMLRRILLRRVFFVNKVSLSSFISGFLSYIVVICVVGFLSGFDQQSQKEMKKKEINEFSQSFIQQNKGYKKEELEYSKIMSSVPKTKSEINYKILKIDEYKNFVIKKNEKYKTLISFYRNINSKYNKDKSIDEQINKLEKITSDFSKSFSDCMDIYKEYLITGDEKYYNGFLQGREKIPLYVNEITNLTKNIESSLFKD